MTPVICTVGTTHPLNIAGLGLSARAVARLGVRLVTVVAGISAQTAGEVLVRTPVDAATIAAQFAAVVDVGVGAIHIGALLDASSVRAVARALPRFAGIPIVCDPVIAASGGGRLADDATIAALRGELFAHCRLVTPNLDEARLLLNRPVADVEAMEAAAAALVQGGCAAVLLKGGHLDGAATDVLFTRGGSAQRFTNARLAATIRGTGDLLATAIAARWAHGDDLAASISAARAFVRTCLQQAVPFAHAMTLP